MEFQFRLLLPWIKFSAGELRQQPAGEDLKHGYSSIIERLESCYVKLCEKQTRNFSTAPVTVSGVLPTAVIPWSLIRPEPWKTYATQYRSLSLLCLQQDLEVLIRWALSEKARTSELVLIQTVVWNYLGLVNISETQPNREMLK